MYVMFDLDGVLVDSQHAIKAAYHMAGVDCPDNILEREGTNWLEEKVGGFAALAVRDRKNDEYIKMIGQAPLLPPYHAAVRLKREGIMMGVLTHAPVGTMHALKTAHNDWPFLFEHEGVTTPERMDILRGRYRSGGLYIDDQMRLIDLPPGWTFIHYAGDHGMHADHMYRSIRARLGEGS